MNSLLIMRTLKMALRKQKVTYRDLAQHLGLTEAAIKKQFQSSDISFNRVALICEFLGISFHSLLKAAKSAPVRKLSLSQEQQTFFANDPELFLFFLKLSEAKGNAKKVNLDFGYSTHQLWKNLKLLDDLGLVRLHEENRVELIYGCHPDIKTEGTFKAKVTYQIGHNFLDRQQHADTQMKELKISLLKLSRENAERLAQEFMQLRQASIRQSEIDSSFLPESECSRYSLMLAFGEFSFL